MNLHQYLANITSSFIGIGVVAPASSGTGWCLESVVADAVAAEQFGDFRAGRLLGVG
jgi:hypothetical protein